MTKRIRPLADRLLVRKEDKKDRKSEGGIYIPDAVSEQGQSAIGEVLDVGEGIYNDKGELVRPLNIKKGDKVVFGKYAGIEVAIPGADQVYLLMQEIDVIGIVEG